MKKLLYRLKQFWLDLFPQRLTQQEQQEIEGQLGKRPFHLFTQYSPSDQSHAYRVFKLLKQASQTDDALLTAALLHDIGKAKYPLTIWGRVWPVVIKKLSPARYYRWGEDEVTVWKRPFAIKQQHPEWGARMAAKAGCDETAVSLIRRHQDPLPHIQTEEDRLLERLQWADDQC